MQNVSRAAEPGSSTSGGRLPRPAANGNFVINLSASTTPVALVQPNHPDLQGFTFFVSRRREDRRERFRLHMGYFQTQEDAEKLLAVVREIFPAAWAGVAPGQRLRAAAVEVERPSLRPAAFELPQSELLNTALVPAKLELVAEPELPAKSELPSAPVAKPAAPTAPAAPAAAKPAPVARVTPTPVVLPAAKAALPTLTAAAPASHPQQVEKLEAVESLDSVRAAIASLGDSSRAAVNSNQQVLSPPAELALLSDTQTLKLLEKSIAPDGDTTIRGRAEIAGFAVQLKWSVQPIDTNALPSLAIFDAYTLYGAEGNRDGRRWYALRLGFFSDSASAKQVAHYVRSEFDSVAVVPITSGERDRAMQAAKQLAPPAPMPPPPSVSGEFKLIDDATGSRPAVAAAATPAVSAAPVAAKPASAAARRPPMSLEETLEVLGANDLKVDNKRGDLLGKSTARALHHAATRKEPQRSKLGKLFERLSGLNH
jgi:hypothetical protein